MKSSVSIIERDRKAVAERLRSKRPADCLSAIEIVVRSKDWRAVPLLYECLGHRAVEVRLRSLEALQSLEPNDDRPSLQAIQDKDELVRVAGAEGLGRRRSRRHARAIRLALRDRSPLVRSYAAAALGRVGFAVDRRRLQQVLRRTTMGAGERLGYLEGLWLLGNRRSFEGALALLAADDYRARCAAARALSTTFLSKGTRDAVRASLSARIKLEPTRAGRTTLRSALRQVSGGVRTKAPRQ